MPLVRKAADVALSARELVRDLGRLQQIARVLGSHGLGWVVANVEVPGIGLLRRIASDPSPEQPTPARIVAVCRELGPTFVKLGQILSTRDDLLPPAYTEALQTLQDRVPPEPWEAVEQQITRALGAPPEVLFDGFGKEPIAAASIAQVHRARLKTGEDVAVKVQRPGIRERIHTDLSILEFLARQVEIQVPEAGALDFPGMIRTLRRAIADETDFRNEAANTELSARNFEGVPWVVVPHVYRAFLAPDVLTLEFLEGTKIAMARGGGADMRLVGERYLSAAFKMLLEDGFFHGDLHPGNVMVLPGERLGLLDFGMVGRLTDEMKENLVDIFFALNRKDFRTIARVYWELAIKPGRIDYSAWEADVQELMERHVAGKSMAEIQVAEFLRELLAGAHRHGVRASPAYTMFFKALVTTEGLAKMLLPEVDPLTAMTPYVERMVRKQYSPERWKEEAFQFVTSFRWTARRLPLLTAGLISDLQDGRLRLRAVNEWGEDERRRLDRQANRLALAVVIAGLVVGGSLALDAGGPRLLGMPAPATICYGLGAGLLLFVIRAVLRAAR
jgi:ubiquinone biosynthesis protein